MTVHVADASQNPVVASRILDDPEGEAMRIREEQKMLCRRHNSQIQQDSRRNPDVYPYPGQLDWDSEDIPPVAHPGITDFMEIAVQDIRPLINWTYFFQCWKTPSGTPAGQRLLREADEILDSMVSLRMGMKGRVLLTGAYSEGESIITEEGSVIPTPRQSPGRGRRRLLSLSDFIAPRGYDDHLGVFMVTMGDRLRSSVQELTDEYRSLLFRSVCDRLAEAASEWLHREVRTKVWGYAPDEDLSPKDLRRGKYRGIRPAVGYPSIPDQRLMHTLADMIRAEELGVDVTFNGALSPASSIAGFYFASARAKYFTL